MHNYAVHMCLHRAQAHTLISHGYHTIITNIYNYANYTKSQQSSCMIP